MTRFKIKSMKFGKLRKSSETTINSGSKNKNSKKIKSSKKYLKRTLKLRSSKSKGKKWKNS